MAYLTRILNWHTLMGSRAVTSQNFTFFVKSNKWRLWIFFLIGGSEQVRRSHSLFARTKRGQKEHAKDQENWQQTTVPILEKEEWKDLLAATTGSALQHCVVVLLTLLISFALAQLFASSRPSHHEQDYLLRFDSFRFCDGRHDCRGLCQRTSRL